MAVFLSDTQFLYGLLGRTCLHGSSLSLVPVPSQVAEVVEAVSSTNDLAISGV